MPNILLNPIPAYKLEIKGSAAKSTLKNRLISISLSQYSGDQSDQLNLELHDVLVNKRIVVPTTNDEIKLWLGYEGELMLMGTYLIDSRQLSGPPDKLTLSAKAVDMSSSIYDQRSDIWKEKTIKDIVSTIAKRCSLEAKVSSSLGSLLPGEIQTNESDMNFLSRLADRYDAIAKPDHGYLLFLKKAEAKSASGDALKALELGPYGISSWNMTISDRMVYKKIQAKWHDRMKAVTTIEEVENSAAKNDKVFTLREVFSTKDEATAAAKAQLEEFREQSSTLNLELFGDPKIMPLRPLKIAGIREHLNGTWLVKSATHSLSNSGYTCSVEAYEEK